MTADEYRLKHCTACEATTSHVGNECLVCGYIKHREVVMTDTKALATVEHGSMQMVTWTPDQVALIKRTICKGATDDELALFIQACKRTGLDPLARQIYAVKRWDPKEEKNVMSIQTAIDGFRLIAERSGKYQGQKGPEWCGPDGKWADVWLKNEPPHAARVGVLRSDFTEPLYAVARYSSYVQIKKDRTPNAMWAKMPDLMIAKVAEALALRRAFPQELSGLYTSDEIPDEGKGSKPPTTKPPADNPELVCTLGKGDDVGKTWESMTIERLNYYKDGLTGAIADPKLAKWKTSNKASLKGVLQALWDKGDKDGNDAFNETQGA